VKLELAIDVDFFFEEVLVKTITRIHDLVIKQNIFFSIKSFNAMIALKKPF